MVIMFTKEIAFLAAIRVGRMAIGGEWVGEWGANANGVGPKQVIDNLKVNLVLTGQTVPNIAFLASKIAI
jgi:hypothetical protein